MTISIKPTASGSTIEQDGSTILTVDGSGNITPNNQLYPKVPAFSAYANVTTSMSSGTWTKIAFQVELWDTNSNYDNATNYRFTPTVAGYYQVNGCFNMATTGLQLLSIYRNGSEYKRGTQLYNPGGTNTQSPVSGIVYLNGSTDYIELYGYQSSGGALNLAQGAVETWFDAVLVSV